MAGLRMPRSARFRTFVRSFVSRSRLPVGAVTAPGAALPLFTSLSDCGAAETPPRLFAVCG